MADKKYAVLSGNTALAMGGAAAGVKFYCAYPMSPSTGVLHWFASNGRKAGIMVRQVEDEIGVINMTIGAAQAGVRAMCATSGGGFALMSEALGLSAMAEIPIVVIDCQRAGPSTGVPTKTEQGDLWQMLGAAFGDYPRVIAAPLDIGDCFTLMAEIWNVVDKFQVPGLVLCDLLLSEGRLSVDPEILDFAPPVDRGEMITAPNGHGNGDYKRYLITDSGVSPRAIPGIPGYTHVVSSDEHDENGVLISDMFTDARKRRAMMEKRMRKEQGIAAAVPPPVLQGPKDADVTLIGWGSTQGVIEEARGLLAEQGITANQLQIRWLAPLHGDAIVEHSAMRSAPSSLRTTTAASLPATCAAKPASSPTDTSANTTASPSCRTTSWTRCANNWPGRRRCPSPLTKSWSSDPPVQEKSNGDNC